MKTETTKLKYDKTSFDILKKTFDPELKAEWEGTPYREHLFLNSYIQDKYKDDLFFVPFTKLNLDIIYKESMEKDFILIFQEFNNDKDYIINKENIDDSGLLFYLDQYKKSNKRFHFFSITQYIPNEEIGNTTNEDLIGHSLCALYDNKSNSIDLFNVSSEAFQYIKKYKKAFNLFFKKIYGNKININYSSICLRFEQINLYYDCFYYQKIINPRFIIDGSCVIWTLWFLDLRLKHKKLPRDKIITKAIDIFKNKPFIICKVITNYGQFIHKITEQIDIIKDKDGKFMKIIVKNKDKKINKMLISIVIASIISTILVGTRLYMYKKIKNLI